MKLLRYFADAIRRPISFRRSARLPGIIYHYTNATGFEGIVRTESLRATNVSFLNDPSEVAYGRELIHKVVSSYERGAQKPLLAFIWKTLAYFHQNALSEVYVACFTSLRDDLSQWRAYGSSALPRYSLGFDTVRVLATAHAVPQTTFSRVLYKQEEQEEPMHQLVRNARGFFDENRIKESDIEPFAQIASHRLAAVVPRLKTPSYAGESEWRVILTPDSGDYSAISFDTAHGQIRPFMTLSFAPKRLPLSVVYVMAPIRPDAARKAAEFVTNRAQLDNVEVRLSSVPFAG